MIVQKGGFLKPGKDDGNDIEPAGKLANVEEVGEK